MAVVGDSGVITTVLGNAPSETCLLRLGNKGMWTNSCSTEQNQIAIVSHSLYFSFQKKKNLDSIGHNY